MSTPSEIYLQGSNDPGVDVKLVQGSDEDLPCCGQPFAFEGRFRKRITELSLMVSDRRCFGR